MNIWRVQMRSEADSEDPAVFAITNGLIGVGWPIDSRWGAPSWEEYRQQGEQLYGTAAWRSAVNALHDRTKTGDLCYIRD